jgi:hypothetical protein
MGARFAGALLMFPRLPIFLCVLSLFGGVVGPKALAQQPDCNRPPLDNPSHGDAMNLAETLGEDGLPVSCVALSKEDGRFGGQVGSARDHTDLGDFAALILPRSENLSRLEIVQPEQSGIYIYTFPGSPRYLGGGNREIARYAC